MHFLKMRSRQFVSVSYVNPYKLVLSLLISVPEIGNVRDTPFYAKRIIIATYGSDMMY